MGERIKAAREAQRLTRKEVAEALGMNQQHVYQIETGRRHPTLETLWGLTSYLGLDPHDFDPRLAHRGDSPQDLT